MAEHSRTAVAHLSTDAGGGGAGIAAYRIHAGLCATGVDSRMYVREDHTGDETVEVVPGSDPLKALRRRLVMGLEYLPYRAARQTGPWYFTDDRTRERHDVLQVVPGGAIQHLHWIAGLIDYASYFAALPRATRLVWTLHDINPLTGGCHYSFGCDRFERECGKCPALGSAHSGDPSSRVHARKSAAYARLDPERVRIVAPSRWIAREAARSSLLAGYDIRVIANGVDATLFRPRNKAAARARFGLPLDARVVMFAAKGISAQRKGLDLLRAALQGIEARWPVHLLCAGAGAPPGGFTRCVTTGELIPDDMPIAYAAADLFVTPAREENLGQVVMEAMACGMPVVAFDIGGMRNLIQHGVNGLLVPAFDTDALRAAIAALLGDAEVRARMGAEGRRIVQNRFLIEHQNAAYRELYEGLPPIC